MHLKHGRYFYTPRIDGKVKWVPLSRDYAEALSKWAELEGTLDRVGTTVGEALDRYLIQVLPSKSEATRIPQIFKPHPGCVRRHCSEPGPAYSYRTVSR